MALSDAIWRTLKTLGLLTRSRSVARDGASVSETHGNMLQDQVPALDLRREVSPTGQFVDRTFSSIAGTRGYKLYIPKIPHHHPMPLVVMLHGCTQNPDDFAAATCMNQLADRHGFLTVYPAQSADANPMRCWNWFNRRDQIRDQGEPGLIAGITREVASEFSVDRQRIFIAGLSAGAAMAVILGAVYPDLFSAVGAHSGLPYGAARSVPSALAAMGGSGQSQFAISGRLAAPFKDATTATPTIVFHGDQDSTVDADNGSDIVDQAVSVAEALHGPLQKIIHERISVNGRYVTTTIYRGPNSLPLVENWVVHGAGHAWSGGSSNGSYADEKGPHASVEIVRFFLAQKTNTETQG